MKYFNTPKYLHEVFGKKQSLIEVLGTLAFAIVGSWIIYLVADIKIDNWKAILGSLLIADVLAGCIANFSVGTNDFYAKRPKNRIIFIAIHVHILAIAWLFAEPLGDALIVWAYTVISAFLVNALKGKSTQVFLAANLMCYGLLLLVYLSLSTWFLMVSILFMIKVLFSFSVDHYKVAQNQ